MNANTEQAPATAHDDHPEVSAANARAGLVLFFVYLAFYAGFMGLAAFTPQAMGTPFAPSAFMVLIITGEAITRIF